MEIPLPRDNPWVLELVRHRVPVLEPLRKLHTANCADDYAAYCQRVNQRQDNTAQLHYIEQLLSWIDRDGYTEEAARTHAAAHGINFSPVSVCVEADGRLNLYDGNHRFSAWWLTERPEPMIAQVTFLSTQWERLLTHVDYQRYDHPLLGSTIKNRGAQRPGLLRYRAILDYLPHSHGGKPNLDLGSCLGLGAELLTEKGPVMGVEYNPYYRTLAESRWQILPTEIAGLLGHCPLDEPRPWTAVVGLSVWHHLATSLEVLEYYVARTQASLHFVELPPDELGPWHQTFRQECRQLGQSPTETVLQSLRRANNFTQTRCLHIDAQYQRRELLLLT